MVFFPSKASPDGDLAKWSALPLEEKKRQLRELMRSPYWRFLPESVQHRIRALSGKDAALPGRDDLARHEA